MTAIVFALAAAGAAVANPPAAAPDHPRLTWVMGPVVWNTPVERGGGQDKAIES